MNEPQSDTLSAYVDQIVAETESGAMNWTKTNPTTFVMRKRLRDSRIAQLSLQKVMGRTVATRAGGLREVIAIDNYVFQATEGVGAIRLIINTQQHGGLRDKLRVLFDTISTKLEREGLDFLRQVISP